MYTPSGGASASSSQVYIVSLGDAAQEDVANVIWLDEIKLLLEEEGTTEF